MSVFAGGSTASSADRVFFDNAGTAITAVELQAALVEIDRLRKKVIGVDVTIPAGYFAFWTDPTLAPGIVLTIEVDGMLTDLG